MTDEQESTGAPSAKRAPRARERPSAAKVAPRGYVAMHEVNAAMCLAGGILGPRFEESAARDHHVAGGGLQIETTAPSARAFAEAKGDLTYGTVVVFEVPPPGPGQPSLTSLPLWRATRLAFESMDALNLFRARMSGFGDVPEDVVPMGVDIRLFAARGDAVQASLHLHRPTQEVADAVQAEPMLSASTANTGRAVDRCAGGLLAAASTLQGRPAAPVRLIERVGGLSLGKPGELPVEQFANAIALAADPWPEAATYAPVLSAVVAVLSSGAMDDGFSATTLQREAEAAASQHVADGSQQQQAIQKFWTFTKDVLALRRDVPDGTWSDEGGSAIARGTLLFMLNPEPEQLKAVRDRTPRLGAAVHFIAGMLVGLRSGLARMGRDVKSARGPFLAGAAFVHDWFHGKDSSLAVQRSWDAVSGSRGCALAYEGVVIAQAVDPADPARVALAVALRAVGIDARFLPDTGDLSGRVGAGGLEATFGAIDAKLPAFPRQDAVEAWTLVPAQLSLRAAAAVASEVNAGTREHCVTARVVDGARGRAAVRLSVLATKPTSNESLREAMAALATTAGALVATASDFHPRRG